VMNRVAKVTLGALTHQDVPFEKLLEQLRPQRVSGRNPLFQVWFVLQNAAERPDFQDLIIEPFPIDSGVTRHDLQLSLWETSSGLKAAFTYSTELFDRQTIVQLAEQFKCLLRTVATQPDIPLSKLRADLDEHRNAYRKRIELEIENSARHKLQRAKRRSVE